MIGLLKVIGLQCVVKISVNDNYIEVTIMIDIKWKHVVLESVVFISCKTNK